MDIPKDGAVLGSDFSFSVRLDRTGSGGFSLGVGSPTKGL